MTDTPATFAGPAAMRRRCAVRVALVAAAFCAVVGGVMAYHIVRANLADPLDDARLRQLRADLAKTPRSENLKADIRTIDQRLRLEYFRRLDLVRRGVWLLMGGAAVLIAAGAYANVLGRKLPMPAAEPAPDLAAARRRSRWALAATAAMLLACAAAAPMLWPGAAPRELAAPAATPAPTAAPKNLKSAATTLPAPSAAEMARQWPRFRGVGGSGVAAFENIPGQWDGPSGKNILWKSPVPLAGFNSPVVWGDRVFVTGATKSKREVYCFAAADGKLLWRRAVVAAGDANIHPKERDDTGLAASTAATDGRYVAAIFANGDIACFDVEGNEQWSHCLGEIDSQYGYASSLDLRDGRVIVQLDQGDAEAAGSRLIAYDAATGKVAWEIPRHVGASWCSPIIIEGPAEPLVIAAGNPLLIAHNLSDGAEVWRAEVMGIDSAPSPVYTGELVLAVHAANSLSAVRADGSGDVTQTHVAWKAEGSIPDICSPLTDGTLAWTLATTGTLTCWDLADGNKVYEQELKQEFNASPSLAGGKLYLLSTKGTMLILDAGREFKEVGRCELAEGAHASPAFAPGRIFIRGRSNLYCIANPGGGAPAAADGGRP